MIEIVVEAVVGYTYSFIESESPHCADGSARSVLRRTVQCSSVEIVARAEEVPVLVVEEQRVHRNHKDVLPGTLVVHSEIVGIILGECVKTFDRMEQILHCFPGIIFSYSISESIAAFEDNVTAIGTYVVGPVVVGIDFGINGEFHHHKIDYVCSHPAIIFGISELAIVGG